MQSFFLSFHLSGYHKTIIFGAFLLTLVPSAFAEGINTYAMYQDAVKQICDAPSRSWNRAGFEGSTIGRVSVRYPDLNASAYQKALDSLGIKSVSEVSGGPAFSVARQIYRTNMDNAYYCAVTADRAYQIRTIQDIVAKNERTEIVTKLKKLGDRYEAMASDVNNCDTNNANTIPMSVRLKNTIAAEYCRYSLYLDLLENQSTLSIDSYQVFESELREALGIPKKDKPATIQEAGSYLSTYQTAFRTEKNRIAGLLTKSAESYRDMQRTYGVHIMLLMIIDDYITLRDHIDLYLANVSQLFMKADNAQDANNR